MRAADLPDPQLELAPQQRPQCRGVAIAHLRGDFLCAHVARLQQVNGPLDAQALEVRERGLPSTRSVWRASVLLLAPAARAAASSENRCVILARAHVWQR